MVLISLAFLSLSAHGEEEEKERRPPPAAVEGAEEDEGEPFAARIRGDLCTRHILHFRKSESDQDLYQSLRAWGGFGEERRLRFFLHGLVTGNMDGRAGDEPFADRGPIFGSNAHGRLEAHGAVRITVVDDVRVRRSVVPGLAVGGSPPIRIQSPEDRRGASGTVAALTILRADAILVEGGFPYLVAIRAAFGDPQEGRRDEVRTHTVNGLRSRPAGPFISPASCRSR